MDFGNQFKGQGVVITGSLGIFGRGIAEAFAAVGAKVCVTDRDQAALDKQATALGTEGSFGFACDLTSVDDMEALIAEVGARWGSADILVNNAGLYPSSFLLDLDFDSWRRVMAVNIDAPFVLMRGFALQMIKAGKPGNMINISSPAAYSMRKTSVPYSSSKTMLNRMNKGFALELAEYGIRVNVIEPGFASGSSVSSLNDEHVTRATKKIPLGRPTGLDDVGGACLYLCSKEASYITGAALAVDGGFSAGSLDVYQDKKTAL
nr:SDR family oxidoreductase [uncultured Cohaesibacter sp.]